MSVIANKTIMIIPITGKLQNISNYQVTIVTIENFFESKNFFVFSGSVDNNCDNHDTDSCQ